MKDPMRLVRTKVKTERPKNAYTFHERMHRYRLMKRCGHCGAVSVFKYHEGHVQQGVYTYCYVCSARNPLTLSLRLQDWEDRLIPWREDGQYSDETLASTFSDKSTKTKLTREQVKAIIAAFGNGGVQ